MDEFDLAASAIDALKQATASLPEGGVDECYVLDLGRSPSRLAKDRPKPGVCPCITATNAWKRLYCTKVGRYLYPQELMLIMGFQWHHIRAATDAALQVSEQAADGLRWLARRAGMCTSPVAWDVLALTVCVWP